MEKKKIERWGTTKRWSDIVSFGGLVWAVEVPDDPSSDLEGQSKQVLEQLEKTLARAKSAKDRLVSCTIYLKDIEQIQQFNAVWEAWVPEGTAPTRACIQAKLARSDYLVEIQVVAAQILG